jgi:hypothetical protein
MAKKNKRSRVLPSRGFGRKTLASELQKVEALLRKQDWSEACKCLQALSQDHPNEQIIW